MRNFEVISESVTRSERELRCQVLRKNNTTIFLSFVERATLYNLVNTARLVHSLFLVYLYFSKFINLYRGAEKSLARPGRKEANVSVRMV